MKIVLVFPPFYLESMYNLPPLGLINLATVLGGSACKAVLLDFTLAVRKKTLKVGSRIYDDCAERILEEKPDLVALSVQCTTLPAVIQICRRIKSAKGDVKLVLGGHTVSLVDESFLMEYPFVDAVVRGEGEWSFKELIGAYGSGGNGEGVCGVTFRRGDEVIRNGDRELISCLDDLPIPDYGIAPPLSDYKESCGLPRSIAIIEVGRGCPHNCIYCSQAVMWRRKGRTFSVERLVKEMEVLHRRFGAECFLLSYDQFTARREFVEAFCRRLIETGLNRIPWYCISRLDSVDAPLLTLMREGGCESMCYGIDSGSDRTLAFIRKRIDRTILCERVRDTADRGITPTLSFVIGFPEEEKRDLDETLGLALQSGIIGNSHPLIQLLTVLPGTDLHERYKKCLTREVDTYFALGLEFCEGKRLPEDEALIKSSREFFSSFYNLPSPARPLVELDLIASYFPMIVRFFPKSFLLLASELEASLSDLFLQWIAWLNKRPGNGDRTITPQECFTHFGAFVSESLADKPPRLKHLPAVVAYEALSLEAGSRLVGVSPFELDIHHLRGSGTDGEVDIRLGEFDFDLQVIIDDLKEGHLKEEYPCEKAYLVFHRQGEELEVIAVNRFGWDLIHMVSRKKTFEEVSRGLYSRHGGGKSREDFLSSCYEAFHELAEMGIIQRPEGWGRDLP